MSMETATGEVLDELLIESQEHLESIEPDLLQLERNPEAVDSELINRIFRGIHSIKGGFGFLGISTIQNLAHVMESVLMKIRDGKLTPTPEMVDVLLQGVDKIREMFDDVEGSEAVDASGVYEGLKPWLDDAPTPEPAPAPPPPEPTPSTGSGFIPLKAAKPAAAKAPAKASAKPAAPPAATKDTDKTAAKRSHGAEVLRVKVNLLNQLMNLAGELVLARNQILQSLDRKLEETAAGQAIHQGIDAAVAETLGRLRSRLNERHETGASGVELVERELKLLRERLLHIQPSRLSDLPGMNASMVNLDSVTTALQENIMQTRMQNMETLFGKLPRQVRELSRKTGKEIYLEISGNEVELDKSIIEALSDPLNHMVRNSLDHGIETPEEREAVGKPRSGRLSVRAFHESGQVNIEIADDGRGIDPAKLKAKAVAKEIITTEQAAQMDDREAIMLIMAPAFSTAEQVSDISGRGVGMDVVRSNIENLGGSIDVESRINEGTRMTLKLPLTLAIIPSLLVRTAGRRFAVPQVSLDELVRLRAGDDRHRIERVQGKEVVRLRGSLLPLVHLTQQLGLEPAAASPDRATDDAYKEQATNILVLKYGEHRYGLVVEDVLDSEEIVVKPLPMVLKDSRCYSGATIMGDGSVAMILDVVGIAEEAALRFGETESAMGQGQTSTGEDDRSEEQTLLVFRNHPSECFALNLDMVARIEKIAAGDIERIGDREFVKYETESLRLIRLHDHMPVKAPEREPDEFYIIIPKLVKHPLGILATGCDDVVTTRANINHDDLTGDGIIGTAVLDRELTVFVDIYSLFEAAEPELYEDAGSETVDRELHVLLAEDTSFFRAMVKTYIESLGYRTETAKDGQEAWEMLQDPEQTYDLLVTDIEMPHLDGIELTRRVRGAEGPLSELPVITLTSLASDEVRSRSLAAGVNAHEIKFDKDILAQTIARVMKEAANRV